MFCPECGKNNQEKATYCEYCGVALGDDSQEGMGVAAYVSSLKLLLKEKIVPGVKKHRLAIIPILTILLVVIIFCAIGSSVSSPEYIAKKYVKNLITENWDAAYRALDLAESDLISYEQFVAYQEQNTFDYSTIMNYRIEEYRDSYVGSETNDLVKTYIISYVTSGASSERSFSLNLVKQNKNTWLFYPSYKVSTEEMLGGYSIQALKGSDVFVDGVQLSVSSESPEEIDGGLTTYEIPVAFLGAHTVSVSHPQCKDYETTIYVRSYHDNLTIDSLELKDEIIDYLTSETEKFFIALCNDAVDGKSSLSYSSDIIKSYMTTDDGNNILVSLSSYFNKSDGTGIKSITFKSFEKDSNQTLLNRYMTYLCRLNFTYDYVELSKSWGSDEIFEQPSTYSHDGYVMVTYVCDGSLEESELSWQLSSIDNFNIYY